MKESDPKGLCPNTPGAKLDAGKIRPQLVMFGFARALEKVAAVATFGANKYSDGGWVQVEDGINRYTDAMFRHLLKEGIGEKFDPQTEVYHAAHVAWNALARLDLMIREDETSATRNAFINTFKKNLLK